MLQVAESAYQRSATVQDPSGRRSLAPMPELARVHRAQGRYEAARRDFEEWVAILREKLAEELVREAAEEGEGNPVDNPVSDCDPCRSGSEFTALRLFGALSEEAAFLRESGSAEAAASKEDQARRLEQRYCCISAYRDVVNLPIITRLCH